jgi:hypothetical protein
MQWIIENAGTLLFVGVLVLMVWMHRPGGHGGCGHAGHRHAPRTGRETPDGRG